MFARRFPRRPAARTPAQLEPAIDACVRNLVADRYAEGGAGSLPRSVLVNPLVRRAHGLEPLDPSLAEAEELDGVAMVLEADEEAARVTKRRLAADRARIAARWAEHGERETVPWAAAPIGRAIRLVARTFGLARLDAQILQLAIACSVCPALAQHFARVRQFRREELADLVAVALGRRAADVRPRLARTAPLFATGLVDVESDMEEPGWTLVADRRLAGVVLDAGLKGDKLLARFLTPEPAATLALEDFDHLKADLGAVRSILDAALATRLPGVNVLLYGPSGVGKTEVARALAASLGAGLFAAGSADEAGEPNTPRERLASLRVGHRLLATARALMLLDELEDLNDAKPWEDGGARSIGKLYFNQLLESNVTPTLWISNSLAEVDPAHLRRYTFALRFPSLGAAQRRKVWTRAAGELGEAELDARAAAYDVSPGEIASAVRVARAVGRGTIDLHVLDRTMAGAVKVMGRRRAPALRAGAEYRPEAVNASEDLGLLADMICAWKPDGRAGVSLCLYGRSGTGKSEFVHWVAQRAGRPLIVRGVSDLESCWVGETEKLIARAFEEAEAQEAILLLDECDWALADRRGAQHSWERTRVVELLQQLEAFRGIVAVTTNLFRDLDQAVLRRFVHKAEFLPLLPHQAVLLWGAHLARFLAPVAGPGTREAASEVVARGLRRIGDLTPGDFGVVARRAAQLGGTWTVEALLAELAAESAARGHEGRPIGF